MNNFLELNEIEIPESSNCIKAKRISWNEIVSLREDSNGQFVRFARKGQYMWGHSDRRVNPEVDGFTAEDLFNAAY